MPDPQTANNDQSDKDDDQNKEQGNPALQGQEAAANGDHDEHDDKKGGG